VREKDAFLVSMQATRDVILRTHSLVAAKAYYHDVLGLPIVADSERLVGFDTGAITLYFELGDDPALLRARPVRPHVQPRSHLREERK
jgi:catechol 2,3-dioxygenase-like lactoylglutathione lyase family enzyme